MGQVEVVWRRYVDDLDGWVGEQRIERGISARDTKGIRSSLALFITSLLAGHLFLRLAWTKTALTLIALPLLIIKNGMRIVTLTLLSIYVDPGFLTGSLHHQGGILFFLIALALLAPALRLLQKLEDTRTTACQKEPVRAEAA